MTIKKAHRAVRMRDTRACSASARVTLIKLLRLASRAMQART
jgi:hypothetical protein